MIHKLLIHLETGETKTIPLEGERLTLGRSPDNPLCFAADQSLSRHHLAFERGEDGWIVRDLGSKNRTFLNGEEVEKSRPLRRGDRITAGHLVIHCDEHERERSGEVVFVAGSAQDTPPQQTLITSLDGVLSGERPLTPQGTPLDLGHPVVRTLLRAGHELSVRRPLPELFDLILGLSVESMGTRRGVLMTLENGQLVTQSVRGGEGFRISAAVRDRVIKEKASLLVRDVQGDGWGAQKTIISQGVRSFMAVPLQTRDNVIGLVYVDSQDPRGLHREFSASDLELLTVLANVAATRIEQEKMKETEDAMLRYEVELQQAAEIQRGLLPTKPLEVPGVDLAGYNAACRTVGGDYYDFFLDSEGRLGLVLADVTGKGLPAALLMATLQARVQVLAEEPEEVARMIARLDRAMARSCPLGRFVTLFFARFDTNTGELAYCNAGHNPPLVIRSDGAVERLQGGGTPLGLFPELGYEERLTRIEPGEVLVMYSDGVTEATNADGEEWRESRLEACVLKHREGTAAEILGAVRSAVADWHAGSHAADDITLVVARRTP